MMKRLVAALALLAFASPALAAGCNPMGGLTPQQWLIVCGPALQEAYAEGQGMGASFEVFAQAMYMVYLQPPANMQMQMPVAGGLQAPVMPQMCTPGATQCFSGWLRTCETQATGSTMWMTGATRC